MAKVYGIAIKKGGMGKSTTTSTLARLLALFGARVLVVDTGQPGTTTSSLRDMRPSARSGALSNVLYTLERTLPRHEPSAEQVRAALAHAGLPEILRFAPGGALHHTGSAPGSAQNHRLLASATSDGDIKAIPAPQGALALLPYDDLLADAGSRLRSEEVFVGLLRPLLPAFDIALIDFPTDLSLLLANTFTVADRILMPLVPEAPALEGLDGFLQLLARGRAAGKRATLGGILLCKAELNGRFVALARTLCQFEEVHGELLRTRLFPFAVKFSEYYDRAFRQGTAVWERTSEPSVWAGYVLLAEWVLEDAGLGHLCAIRRGPALLPPQTRIIDALAQREMVLEAFRAQSGMHMPAH
jgi:cellulose biosynthesis protein BcsQ